MNSQNNSVTDPATLVANGPGGVVTETNLDGGMNSNMGFVNLGTVTIPGRVGLIHTGAANNSVTFSYPFGAGFVIYSSIPLDMFLKGLGPAAPSAAFRTIYAPNVLAYAACGLRAFPATVTATSATGHYGGTTTLSANVRCGVTPVAGVSVNFSLNGVPAGSALTDASGTATLANAKLGLSPESAIAVGSYPAGVLAAFAGTTQYGASSGTASLTVERAPASISFNGGTFVYDATPHAATNGSVTGVFGEPLGAPSFSYMDEHDVTSDAAPVNAGTYRITASVPESVNYLATSVGSGPKIKITPAALTVRADDKTKVYGAPLPALTASYDGFVLHDGPSALAGSLLLTTGVTAASSVGAYAITPSGLNSTNYAISFIPGTLAVTPAPLTVRAENAAKTYGAVMPAFTARYEGLVLGETPAVLAGSLSFTTDATVTSHVGRYSVTPSGLASTNYAITFVDGYLLITPAPLTIRAEDKERLEGLPNPVLTVRFQGFVLDDSEASLDARPKVSTPADAKSPDGTYPILVRGAADQDYTIEHVDGTLTVSPEGRMHGTGVVEAPDARHLFELEVRERIVPGEKGSLRLEINRKKDGDDRFVSELVTNVVFRNIPGVVPGGKAETDAVTFVGVGRWNGQPATFEAVATDTGEPGAGSDTVTIKIFAAGKMVNVTSGPLKSGNIQSNRLPRR